MLALLSARAWHPRRVNACLAPIAHGADHNRRPHRSLLATSLFFRELSVSSRGSLCGRSSCRVAGLLSQFFGDDDRRFPRAPQRALKRSG
jgi:hypothetical protein